MATTITAHPYGTSLPGAAVISVQGDPNVTLTVYRQDKNGRHPVRTDLTTDASGFGQVVDAEPAFGWATYSLATGETAPATYIPPLASGKALLRSLLHPNVSWREVVWVDEVDVDFPTSSTVFPVINASNPVVVADVRRERNGTLILWADNVQEADQLLYILRDGAAFLLRACDQAREKVRDTYFFALDVREERINNGRRRLITVEYQSVDSVIGITTNPPAPTWTYQDLADQTTAPTYADVLAIRSTYLDLAVNPISP